MAKSIPGSQWQREKGQRSLGVTLAPEEHAALHDLLGGLEIGKAEAARRLLRWALAQAATEAGKKKIRKILSSPIDSVECAE